MEKKYGLVGSRIVFALAVILPLIQIYEALFGVKEAYQMRALYLTIALLLIFLMHPLSKKKDLLGFKIFDVIILISVLFVGSYVVINSDRLQIHAGASSMIDVYIGALFIILVFEATRRAVGWPMVIITGSLFLYAVYGRYFPGMLIHTGFSYKEMVEYTVLTSNGLFGLPLGAMITTIFIFMILAVFLLETGLTDFFSDIANGLLGHYRGGPAKVSVLSSGLMGMISGAATANVVTTGAITIPTMKKMGYSPEHAAAIEASASTGGQIMPPIMAAAGFLIAAMIGVPYIQVAIAATLPAILYFLAVGIATHVLAVRYDLKGFSKENLPRPLAVLKTKGYLAIPIVLIVILLAKGYSPMAAGIWAIITTIILSYLDREKRLTPKRIIIILEKAGKSVLELFVICAIAGIIVAALLMSGLTMKMPLLIKAVAGQNLFLTLACAAFGLLILGCGMTTTAAYVIGATTMAPAIINLGVSPMAAHLFILYFGIMNNVTPPVALSAYAGASIAGAGFWSTSWEAFKIASVGFLIPFAFVSKPALLLQGTVPEILWAVFTMLFGVVALCAATQGYIWSKITAIERIIYLVAVVLLAYQSMYTDFIGLLLVIIGIVFRLVAERVAANKAALNQ